MNKVMNFFVLQNITSNTIKTLDMNTYCLLDLVQSAYEYESFWIFSTWAWPAFSTENIVSCNIY
jgi:hypothetical protein